MKGEFMARKHCVAAVSRVCALLALLAGTSVAQEAVSGQEEIRAPRAASPADPRFSVRSPAARVRTWPCTLHYSRATAAGGPCSVATECRRSAAVIATRLSGGDAGGCPTANGAPRSRRVDGS